MKTFKDDPNLRFDIPKENKENREIVIKEKRNSESHLKDTFHDYATSKSKIFRDNKYNYQTFLQESSRLSDGQPSTQR